MKRRRLPPFRFRSEYEAFVWGFVLMAVAVGLITVAMVVAVAYFEGKI